jgi:D-alanyl-D-alanine carboxypeptidase/D-alanyl-D-alanine-endopeptidase (penicillin-binding protein 4)
VKRRSSAPAPLLVLGAVVLVPAFALFGLWRFAAGQDGETVESLPPTTVAGAQPVASTPVLNTPLLSFRRVPGLIARDLNDDSFAAALNGFAATLDPTSCVVVQLDGVEVGSHNPDLAVIPASNQKLVTAAAALHVLGHDHVFTTQVRADLVNGGVVAGNLYLVGGGDPLLTTNDFLDAGIIRYPVTSPTSLDALADSVVAAGVTRVDGDVVGDGTRYDDEWYQDNWGDGVRVTEAGPLDALLVNDSRYLGGNGWEVAEDPNQGAAREFARLLTERGVTIGGDTVSGAAPADLTVVASVDSAALPAVVAEMQGTSDNNTAELLVKEIGLKASGGPTREAGAAAITAALAEIGIDTAGFVVADGSGLSNENRVTCRGLATILARFEPGDAFAAGLPVAGESGTLSDAFEGTAVEGRMVAKTGSLGNPPYNADPPAVKSLSGYLPVEGGGTIEFALILNSPSINVADQSVNRPIWDAFGEMLATYPAGPSVAELGPG